MCIFDPVWCQIPPDPVRKVEDSQPQRALWMRPPLPAPPAPAPAVPADARPRRRGADSTGRFVVDLMGKLYLQSSSEVNGYI